MMTKHSRVNHPNASNFPNWIGCDAMLKPAPRMLGGMNVEYCPVQSMRSRAEKCRGCRCSREIHVMTRQFAISRLINSILGVSLVS